MMSIDQMELLFQLLIAQNSDKKVSELFPTSKEQEHYLFNQCKIIKETLDTFEEFEEIEIYGYDSMIRYRILRKDNIYDFITWDKKGKAIVNDYEQYLSYLLKFVSFEDKV